MRQLWHCICWPLHHVRGPSSAAPHRTITQAQTLQSAIPAQSTPLAASVQSAADQWKATPPLFLPPNPPPNPSPLVDWSQLQFKPLGGGKRKDQT